MKEVVRELENIKKHSNLISIGKRVSKVYVYKYMTLKTAVTCLNNNTFMFSLPPIWDPWSMCLSKISIDAQNPADEETLREALEKNSAYCMHKYSLQYKPYVPIELENIYKPFKPITIEK